MTDHESSPIGAALRIVGTVAAWIGTLKLADVQLLVAAASGLAVLVYAVLQSVVLVRDKFMRDQWPSDRQ